MSIGCQRCRDFPRRIALVLFRHICTWTHASYLRHPNCGEVESSADQLSEDIHDDAKILVLGIIILALFHYSSKYTHRPTTTISGSGSGYFGKRDLPIPVSVESKAMSRGVRVMHLTPGAT